jgi:hypothetical protein
MNGLVKHVERSIRLAFLGVSNLNKEIYYLEGMSSPKIRSFLNNVCEIKGANYLEIGCWKGSTAVSALYNNSKYVERAVLIDNFSQFDDIYIGIKEEIADSKYLDRDYTVSVRNSLLDNINKYCYNTDTFFIDNDCFDILTKQMILENYPNFQANIYFYDGPHTEEDQKQAFTFYNDMLQDVFIAIVDDWNIEDAKIGTKKAFKELGYNIIIDHELPSKCNGDGMNWWNGLYIAIIQK